MLYESKRRNIIVIIRLGQKIMKDFEIAKRRAEMTGVLECLQRIIELADEIESSAIRALVYQERARYLEEFSDFEDALRQNKK